mgnify:FL=1|jgi:hypothetical protein
MTGSKKVFTVLGSSNHVAENREAFDYYATDPKAVEMLLELEQFAPVIWEPACGEGHISKVLQAHGYQVISTDLVYRGFGDPEPLDFLKETLDGFEGDIITNPPYSTGLEFVQRALESVRPGGKVAMFLKVQFLEGQKRGAFFKDTPPRTVYISRSRLSCAKNGDFERFPDSAIAYAWYVWEKGFTGDPVIKWFN